MPSLTTASRRHRSGGLVTLLAFVLVMLAPGLALAVDGTPGNPSDECAGLLYLDKFGFNESGSGSFDQDTGSATDSDDSADGYSYTSSTGVTVSYTVSDGGEVHAVSWSSTVPLDRVWLKAGNDTDEGVVYDEATSGDETVVGNAFSHITFCYDEDQPEDPTAAVSGECDEATVTITNPDEVEFSVDVFINDVKVDTITASKDYTLEEGETLTTSVEDAGSFAWEDCSEGVPSSVEFEVAGECTETGQVPETPAVAYAVDFTQGDVPIESVLLTVSDADGNVLGTVPATDDLDGVLAVSGLLSGATVDVTWDQDDSVTPVLLPDDCAEVLGVVTDREPPAPSVDPAVDPVDVAGEELAAAGGLDETLLLLGLGFLMIGVVMVLSDRSTARRTA